MKLYVHQLYAIVSNDFAEKAANALADTIISFCEREFSDNWASELVAKITYGYDVQGGKDPAFFSFVISSFEDLNLTKRRYAEARDNNELFKGKTIWPGFEKIERAHNYEPRPLDIEARYQKGRYLNNGEVTFADKTSYCYGFSLSKEEIQKQSEYALSIISTAIRENWN